MAPKCPWLALVRWPGHAQKAPVIHSSLYLPEAVYEALRKIAFDERVKIHHLVVEGLDGVLKRRGYRSVENLKDRLQGCPKSSIRREFVNDFSRACTRTAREDQRRPGAHPPHARDSRSPFGIGSIERWVDPQPSRQRRVHD
jgi:hypothetical protein